MQNYTLKVIELREETSDTLTVVFKQPLKKLHYTAGQYLTLIFRINGRRYIRPYSFSSAPGVDATINVTVKRVPQGVVSNHILDKVKVGDLIEVVPPMGNFILPDSITLSDKHIVLWGSGSGITPLISLIKFCLHENVCKHVTLVYGNKSFETTIFHNEITDLKNKLAGKFSVWHFHTKATVDQLNPFVIQGRIAPRKVLSVMQTEGDVQKTLHYICGPRGLKESVKETLLSLQIPQENIYTEDFEIVRDPKEFENIITRSITVEKSGQKAVLEVTKGKSILEACLDAMIEVDYSCQTGNCLLCRAKLINGHLKTIGVKELSKDLSEDERLLCCSFPLTDDIEILIENQ